MPATRSIFAPLALMGLIGCAQQPPSFGELVAQEGRETGEIAARWEAGRVAVEAAEADVEAARADIRDTRRRIERGAAELRAAERDLERARSRRKTGLRRMRAAEVEYGEAFPDRPIPNSS